MEDIKLYFTLKDSTFKKKDFIKYFEIKMYYKDENNAFNEIE